MKRSKRIILKLILIFLLAFLTNGVVMAENLTLISVGENLTLESDVAFDSDTIKALETIGHRTEVIYSIKDGDGNIIGGIARNENAIMWVRLARWGIYGTGR